MRRRSPRWSSPLISTTPASFRASHVTGDIGVHEVAFAGDELWLVNTRFSCLCTLNPKYSFVPRWRPPFVTALAAEDRCHLNGLTVVDGRPKYVTALGETDTTRGWHANKAHGGCMMEVSSGAIVSRGLSMPHSPRWHDGRLWLLESGTGQLVLVDPTNGNRQSVVELPGFGAAWPFTDGTRSSDCQKFARHRRWTECHWPNDGTS